MRKVPLYYIPTIFQLQGKFKMPDMGFLSWLVSCKNLAVSQMSHECYIKSLFALINHFNMLITTKIHLNTKAFVECLRKKKHLD